MSLKVLVVEDEEVLRDAVSCIVEVKEYEFLAVEDGQYAWEALPTFKPDLIITDIKMPRMTGIELLELVRGSEFSEIPVIIMSAYALDEYKQLANTLGISAYITKPFSLIEMVEAIEIALEPAMS